MDPVAIGLILIFLSACLFVLDLVRTLMALRKRIKTLIVDDDEGTAFYHVSKYKFLLRPRVVGEENWIDELLADNTYTLVITAFPEVVFHVREYYRKTTIFFVATPGQEPELQHKAVLKAHAVLREPIGKDEISGLLKKFFS